MTMLVKALHKIPPEMAHNIALKALATGVFRERTFALETSLQVSLWGRHFPHPIGLAAGFDKNAVALPALFSLGFSFVEVGTVTPRPQKGNTMPRLFRLPDDRAIINRMGLNNDGMEVIAGRLGKFVEKYPERKPFLGVSIGPNKTSVEEGETAVRRDICALVDKIAPYAGYLVVNVSSPNTTGLREYQSQLGVLVTEAKNRLGRNPVPFLVKLAPDMAQRDLKMLVETVMAAGVDGIIATNTTVDRPNTLKNRYQKETGGLSGEPLRQKSTARIREIHEITQGKVPLIGVGGIFTAQDVREKMDAGADLVQIYTSFVYCGPEIVEKLYRGLIVPG